MKKIAVVLSVLLVVLAGVLFIRAMLFTSKQEKIAPADPPIIIDVPKIVQNLSQAVQIKTISHLDPAKISETEFVVFHRFLENAYPRVHQSLKREFVNRFSLLYTWKGTDDRLKPLILMAHMDVVPVEPGTEGSWTYPPFSGAFADGYIWGRGTLDYKGGLLASLEAVEHLLATGYVPSRTVYLAFGHDEELGGSQGAKKIAELLTSRHIKAEYTLDEGTIVDGVIKGINAPVALVNIAEKGYLSLELTVSGEGGHSSIPPAETAVGILCTAVSKLEKNPFPLKIGAMPRRFFEYIGPEMSFGSRIAIANLWLLEGIVKAQLAKSPPTAALLHTTVAPTMLQGSIKDNLLPLKATAVINFRIMPGDSSASVMAYCRKIIDDPRVQMKALGAVVEPSPVSDIDSPGFIALKKTVHQVFPTVVAAPFLGLYGTDARHYSVVSDDIYRFCPLWYKPEDLKRLHGTNERIAVANYENVVKFYVQLIKNSSP